MINVPHFELNENNGGINWGFCKTQEEEVLTKKNSKKYTIFVSTSTMKGSETTSVIYITLKGSEGESSEHVLNSHGFKQGSYEKLSLFSEDVGNLKSIKIRNGGNSAYRCNTIKVESDTNYWNFECKNPIRCPDKCAEELMVVNLVSYEVTVKTSKQPYSHTRYPIFIKFIGTSRTSPEKLLSDKGFVKGTLSQISVDTADVGIIYGITLYIKGYDNFKPDEIIIKKPGINSFEKIFKIPENFLLESPEKPMMIKLPKPTQGFSRHLKREAPNEYVKDKVIELSCTDRVKDNEHFGPKYVTNRVNYAVYYARCPANCMRIQERGVGLGIHPEESPICINAIVDRAVSLYGGIISISIFAGLPSYTGGKKV